MKSSSLIFVWYLLSIGSFDPALPTGNLILHWPSMKRRSSTNVEVIGRLKFPSCKLRCLSSSFQDVVRYLRLKAFNKCGFLDWFWMWFPRFCMCVTACSLPGLCSGGKYIYLSTTYLNIFIRCYILHLFHHTWKWVTSGTFIKYDVLLWIKELYVALTPSV